VWPFLFIYLQALDAAGRGQHSVPEHFQQGLAQVSNDAFVFHQENSFIASYFCTLRSCFWSVTSCAMPMRFQMGNLGVVTGLGVSSLRTTQGRLITALKRPPDRSKASHIFEHASV
jgi:hypothetical protein